MTAEETILKIYRFLHYCEEKVPGGVGICYENNAIEIAVTPVVHKLTRLLLHRFYELGDDHLFNFQTNLSHFRVYGFEKLGKDGLDIRVVFLRALLDQHKTLAHKEKCLNEIDEIWERWAQ